MKTHTALNIVPTRSISYHAPPVHRTHEDGQYWSPEPSTTGVSKIPAPAVPVHQTDENDEFWSSEASSSRFLKDLFVRTFEEFQRCAAEAGVFKAPVHRTREDDEHRSPQPSTSGAFKVTTPPAPPVHRTHEGGQHWSPQPSTSGVLHPGPPEHSVSKPYEHNTIHRHSTAVAPAVRNYEAFQTRTVKAPVPPTHEDRKHWSSQPGTSGVFKIPAPPHPVPKPYAPNSRYSTAAEPGARSSGAFEKSIIKTERYRTGFRRNLEPLEIAGMTVLDGRRFFLMKWRGCNKMDLVHTEEANSRCPQTVIKYYESNLVWRNGRA